MADLGLIASALRLGDRVLAEQCETGDPVTQGAVEQVVEVIAQRVAQVAEADALRAPLPHDLAALPLPERPGTPERPDHAAEVSCQALAMRLRGLAADLATTGRPGYAATVAPAVERLARALSEHALGLNELARAWPPDDIGPRVERARARGARLQRILLAELAAVLRELTH